jgi:predicted AAA+ superfamily ATPase
LLLVRRLPPWAGNAGKRLVKSPKVYIRDSGLAHALLGISSLHDLVGHPVQGGSWEGLVIDNLVALLPPSATASFYRTGAGAEIDLVLQLTPQQCWVVEVKRSLSPVLSRGFHSGAEEVAATRRYVIYPGAESYPLDRQTTVLSLPALMAELSALARADGDKATALRSSQSPSRTSK